MNALRTWSLMTAAALSACGPSERPSVGDPWTTLEGWEEHGESAVNVAGYVEHREVEGGVWVIREPGGTTWSPVNLPEAFQIDGAGVVADVRLRPDLLSIGMVGELVEVLRIRHGAVPEARDDAVGTTAVAVDGGGAGPGADLFGEWRVVDSHVPGVSAMSESRAASWRGRALIYGPSSATSPNGDCAEASFAERSSSVDALLSGEFGVPPETMPLLADRDEVRVVDVRCRGASWDAVGQTVLLLDERRALTPWDGVFFELRRTR